MSINDTDRDQALRQLLDRAEITDLLSRRGRLGDEMRYDEVRDVFADDVVFVSHDGIERARGADTLRDMLAGLTAKYSAFHHAITNTLVELDGDRATVRSNIVATHVLKDDPTKTWVVKGSYHDEAIRTPNGWRLSRCQPHRIWEGIV